MKKILILVTLFTTLTACSNSEINSFFDNIETYNYVLTITVNENYVSIIEVNNNIAYAYNYTNDIKSEEVYFTNLDSSYKTYIYNNGSWKTTNSNSYYDNYFGILQLKNQNFEKEDNYYTFSYDIAIFKFYPTDNKVSLTNIVTNEYVLYQYDFEEVPIINIPF